MALPEDLSTFLRDQRASARASLRQLAETTDLSAYRKALEEGLPSPERLQALARGLREQAESLVPRAGDRGDSEDRGGAVEAAVEADPVLTSRQRRVLLDIYASFKAENARATATDVPAEPAADDEGPDAPAPERPSAD